MNVPASLSDSSRRTRSIIIFAAVLALLAALLLGGFYFAKYRGEQAANPEVAEVEKPDTSRGENTPVGEPEETPPTTDNNPSVSSESDESDSSNIGQNGLNNDESVENIPSSGPTENAVLGAFMIGAFIYVLSRYVQSRRLRHNA